MPDEYILKQIGAACDQTQVSRALADETPVALELNGISYAVLKSVTNSADWSGTP